MMLVIAMPFAAAACGGDSGGTVTLRVERPPFNAVRAFQDLETQVAFGPRIPGSAGHAQQLEWLETQAASARRYRVSRPVRTCDR